MKCDTCIHKRVYQPGRDEMPGAFEYCNKDHWSGGDPIDKDEVITIWDDCIDYSQEENK